MNCELIRHDRVEPLADISTVRDVVSFHNTFDWDTEIVAEEEARASGRDVEMPGLRLILADGATVILRPRSHNRVRVEVEAESKVSGRG